MLNKLIWWIKENNSKLHNFKILFMLFCLFLVVFIGCIVPWMYGVIKIVLLIT